MSFFNKNQIIKVVLSPSIKAIIESLYCLSGCYKNIVLKKYKNNWKRAFSFASLACKGSFTLEASIVTTIFLFSVLSVAGIMITLEGQQEIQIAIDNVAKDTAKKIYFSEKISELAKNNKYIDVENKIDRLFNKIGIQKDSEYIRLTKEVISDTLLKSYIDRSFDTYINSGNVENIMLSRVSEEIDFSNTYYDREQGQLIVVANYSINIPFVPKTLGSLKSEKKSVVKVWNGKSVCQEQNKVYITKTGKVYHTRKDCSHIAISLRECSYKNIGEKRNNSGGKYYRCPKCCGEDILSSQIVYYAEYGTVYHIDIGCSGITRNVIEVDISQVGDRKICSDCENNK